MRTSRPVRLVAPLVLAALALSACGGGGGGSTPGADSDSPTTTSQSPTAPPLPTTWPLTGLDAPDGASLTTHPVLIAKIDNTEDSDPQYGLGKADLITEELVEGGITRLAAFFYTNLPSKVGPIRSMRLTDIGIAKPVNARLVTSGAAPVTLNGLRKAGVKFYDMSNPNVVRDYDHSHDYLHSVVANLAKLGAQSGLKTAKRPRDYMPWGTDADFTGVKPAVNVDASFSGYRTDHWHFDGSKYELENNYFAKGDDFTPDTIVVVKVNTTIAPYKDPAGNPVPVSHFDGTGKALIFHDGKFLRATWVKKGEKQPVAFQDATGTALKIPAGHVWLELIPNDGGKVTWTRK